MTMATASSRVVSFDTTLRDGEQAPGFSLEVPAKVHFQTPDGLADGRLRAMHLGSGARKAALLGNGQERLQSGDVHKLSLLYRNDYHFDF